MLTFLTSMMVVMVSSLPAVNIYGEVEDHSLNLTLVHINDFHAHFEQTNVYTARCKDEQATAGQCYGGVARLFQAVEDVRAQDPDTIFLNAGDFYQGTAWYTKLKYGPMITFGNKLNYTAMGLGNHDFDDHIEGYAPFAEGTNFPLLAANLALHNVTNMLEGTHFNKSTVVTVKGRKIGIVGYVTRSTIYNFPDREVEFLDEVETVGAEARRLKANGVEIIIALGHSGYEMDIVLAESIPELDVVVGGHSHTFLYTLKDGEELPSIESPAGDYPTYVTNNGKVIPVVQAYCYTKYLGHLELQFDESGDLKQPVEGAGVTYAQPILLDSSIDQNQEVLEMMKPFLNNLTEFKENLGENKRMLQEEKPSEESNIGDLIAEAMAAVYKDNFTRISFQNNGGIRSWLEVGNVTYDDVFYVCPFDNTVDFVQMRGSGILKSLENAASSIDSEDVNKYPGFGYQISGLRIEINAKLEVGSRVTKALVEEWNGSEYVFSDIEPTKLYNMALPSFLAGGGTKNQKHMRGIFDGDIETHIVGDVMIYEAVRDYIKATAPLDRVVDGRLVVTATTPSGGVTQKLGLLVTVVTLLWWSTINL